MSDEGRYEPRIINVGARYCVYLPEKKIFGEGETLDAAYREYIKKLEASEISSERYGLATIAQEPYPVARHRELIRELIVFWIKIVSLSVIVILVLVLFMPNIRAAAEYHASAYTRFLAMELPKQLNYKLDRLKPEEELEMSKEWRKVIGRATEILSRDENTR